METIEIVQTLGQIIADLGTLGILLYVWKLDRQRADDRTQDIIDDWKRQNDREYTAK